MEVVSVDMHEKLLHNTVVGEDYNINICLDVKDLNDKGIGVELVVTKYGKNNKDMLYDVEEFELVKTEGSKLFFQLDYQLNRAGSFKYGFRMYPKNEDLPHRQDFCFVRWI